MYVVGRNFAAWYSELCIQMVYVDHVDSEGIKHLQRTPQRRACVGIRRPNQIVGPDSIFKRNNAGLWIISATKHRDPLGDLAQRWCTMRFSGYINKSRSTDTI